MRYAMTRAPPWMASCRGGKGRRKRSRRRNDRCLCSDRWSGGADGKQSIHICGERPHDAGFLQERRVVGRLALQPQLGESAQGELDAVERDEQRSESLIEPEHLEIRQQGI